MQQLVQYPPRYRAGCWTEYQKAPTFQAVHTWLASKKLLRALDRVVLLSSVVEEDCNGFLTKCS